MNRLTKIIKLSFLFAFLFLFSCTYPTYHLKTAFSEEEFAPYAKKGTATIVGQAFLKTRGGTVKYGAGNIVELYPVTSYSSEIITAMQAEKYGKFDNIDKRVLKYVKKTIADGEGRFEFDNIPAGDYYVCCTVRWEVPSEYGSYTTGANIAKEITVKKGEKVKIIITR